MLGESFRGLFTGGPVLSGQEEANEACFWCFWFGSMAVCVMCIRVCRDSGPRVHVHRRM